MQYDMLVFDVAPFDWDAYVAPALSTGRVPVASFRAPVADLSAWALTIGLPRLAEFCSRHRDVLEHLHVDAGRLRAASPRQERLVAEVPRREPSSGARAKSLPSGSRGGRKADQL